MSTELDIDLQKEYIEKHHKYCFLLEEPSPVVMVEAKGSIMKDINGKEYIDFISGTSGTTSIGSSHPKVIKAVKEQLDKLPCVNPGFINIPKVQLAEKLAKIMPGNLGKFYFFCGGGESVEFAIRNAIRSTGKREIISLYFGYHGSLLSTLNLGHAVHRRTLPSIPGFRQIPPPYCYRCFYGQKYPGCNFECAKGLENMIKYGTYHDVGAFVVEPMMGVAGHIVPPKEYFKIIRRICDEYGVFLIFDEIQTGFGRTGKMFGADYFNVQPDTMVIGKALGGGIPISAAVFRDDIRIPFREGLEINTTFSGYPIGCAAASAAIDVMIEEELPERASTTGKLMMERLKTMQEKHPLIGEVRGAGLYIGVELVKNRNTKEEAIEEAHKVLEKCLERGLILVLSGGGAPKVGNTIKIKPPLNINKELVAKALDILDKSLYEVEKDSGLL